MAISTYGTNSNSVSVTITTSASSSTSVSTGLDSSCRMDEWEYKGHEIEYDGGSLWIDGEQMTQGDVGFTFYTKSNVREHIDEHYEDLSGDQGDVALDDYLD